MMLPERERKDWMMLPERERKRIGCYLRGKERGSDDVT